MKYVSANEHLGLTWVGMTLRVRKLVSLMNFYRAGKQQRQQRPQRQQRRPLRGGRTPHPPLPARDAVLRYGPSTGCYLAAP